MGGGVGGLSVDLFLSHKNLKIEKKVITCVKMPEEAIP